MMIRRNRKRMGSNQRSKRRATWERDQERIARNTTPQTRRLAGLVAEDVDFATALAMALGCYDCELMEENDGAI